MKVNLLDMTKKVLFEEIGKPSKEEEKTWSENNEDENNKLYYVIRGEDNEIIKYIDSNLVEEVNKNDDKKHQPKKVAEMLFEQIGVEEATEAEAEEQVEDQDIVSQVQELIDNNKFLKGKQVSADDLYEAGNYYLYLNNDSLEHVTSGHTDPCSPGSLFFEGLNAQKLAQAIQNLISNKKPSEVGGGKYKWLGQDTGIKIGYERLFKYKNEEKFNNLPYYVYNRKMPDGTTRIEKVKVGFSNESPGGTPTRALTFIGATLGQVNGKEVLSMLTAFPGANGVEITDRNDFAKKGYYFVIPKECKTKVSDKLEYTKK